MSSRAVASSDAGGVLVNVNALVADGWSPQQLATELVDDLRQAFLAALAPELCAVSGAQRAAFAKVAESMGLARVVRSMEILGRALVDMRDAPDAQVVLEIAIVQAARPDLDQSTAALAERVSALERMVAAGAHSAPQSSGAHAIPQLNHPDSSKASADSGNAAEPLEVGRQPSIGAIMRSRNEPAAADRNGEKTKASPPEEKVEPKGSDKPQVNAGVGSGAVVDRDSLTQAWGDGVLQGLSARAKALYSVGRFVESEGEAARFALPNAAHRDKCLERVTEVEEALGAHFGTRVRLELIVDGVEAGASNGAAPIAAVRPSLAREPEDVLEDEDPDELDSIQGDEDHQASAVDRLLRTFPGASEVDE